MTYTSGYTYWCAYKLIAQHNRFKMFRFIKIVVENRDNQN